MTIKTDQEAIFLKFLPVAGSWIRTLENSLAPDQLQIEVQNSAKNGTQEVFYDFFACGGQLVSPTHVENSLVPDQLQIQVQNRAKMALKK